MIKATLALIAVALGLAASIHVKPSPLPTRHDAKVRTFKALLHLTEERPDVVDATHAAVTVKLCSRRSYGFRCEGSLSPVAISGIPGSNCDYVVIVFRHSVRLSEANC